LAEIHQTIHPKYRPDVDGLRAVAILAVLGFHAFPEYLGGGFVGVDVFFVISGFLISSIIFSNLEQGSFSYAGFYARRIRRIFPALALVLIACLVFAWFWLLPGEYVELGRYTAAGVAFVSNLLSWSHAGYFDKAADTKPLLHLWSLGVEEQFYIVWPLLVGLCWRFRFNFLAVTLLVALASFTVNAATASAYPIADFYSPLSRFWELMLGGLLAYAALHRPELLPKRIDLCAVVGLALIVAAALLLDQKDEFPGWWALGPTLGAFLVIAARPEAWVNRYILGNRVMVGIGLISYPLYLWHLPLLVFARIIGTETPPPWERALLLAASFVLATATYLLVERPVRFSLPTRVAVPALVTVMAAALLSSLLIVQEAGVPKRFGPGLQGYFTFLYKFGPGGDARYGSCWVSEQTAADGYGGRCVDAPRPGQQLMLLWGDSHAARFYPGLRIADSGRHRIAQFTRNLCSPILALGRHPLCDAADDFIMGEVRSLKPSVVVLFAYWDHYLDTREGDPGMGKLLSTIAAIRQAGVERVIVMGPAPVWQNTLPDDLFRDAINQHVDVLPARTYHQMSLDAVRGLDTAMRQRLAGLQGVTYFSVFDLLCDQDGCLTTVNGKPDGLTAYDYSHMPTVAATYVAQAMLKDTGL
jgi:peptidoglycan/LPS O-acetylase OafA/YrhL